MPSFQVCTAMACPACRVSPLADLSLRIAPQALGSAACRTFTLGRAAASNSRAPAPPQIRLHIHRTLSPLHCRVSGAFPLLSAPSLLWTDEWRRPRNALDGCPLRAAGRTWAGWPGTRRRRQETSATCATRQGGPAGPCACGPAAGYWACLRLGMSQMRRAMVSCCPSGDVGPGMVMTRMAERQADLESRGDGEGEENGGVKWGFHGG